MNLVTSSFLKKTHKRHIHKQNNSTYSKERTLEGLKIELELSASGANFSILSPDGQQSIITNPPAGGGVFKQARCSDSSSGTCIQVEVSGVIWSFDIELYVDNS